MIMKKILNMCICDWNDMPDQAIDGPIFTKLRKEDKIKSEDTLESKADSSIVDTLFYTGLIDLNVSEIFLNIYINESEKYVRPIQKALNEWNIDYKLYKGEI